jgi:hypothetical protein
VTGSGGQRSPGNVTATPPPSARPQPRPTRAESTTCNATPGSSRSSGRSTTGRSWPQAFWRSKVAAHWSAAPYCASGQSTLAAMKDVRPARPRAQNGTIGARINALPTPLRHRSYSAFGVSRSDRSILARSLTVAMADRSWGRDNGFAKTHAYGGDAGARKGTPRRYSRSVARDAHGE